MVRTSTKGIFQSDVIIRTALIRALDDVRKNPWLLDFAFASLVDDELTNQEYGAAELEKAKEWFLGTEIPVAMAYRLDQITTPLIAISLEDSSEGATTLGDVHSSPTEDVEASEILLDPAPILPSFTPKSYTASTGTVVLPDSLDTSRVFPGMLLFDTVSNRGYVIADVLDSTSFTIQAGTKANFKNAVVAPASSFAIARLESVEEREAYRIDLYVSGNSAHLLYLYAILKFCLYRYKQELFEGRGFERSQVTSTGVRLFQGKQAPEVIFTRTFTLTGFVRQYWPKDITRKIDGFVVSEAIQDAPSEIVDGWLVEEDLFGNP
jgi:hypothetical protein